jgi:hypothetical protein
VNLVLTFVFAGFAAVYSISVSFLGVCFQFVSISGFLYIDFQSCIGSSLFWIAPASPGLGRGSSPQYVVSSGLGTLIFGIRRKVL